MSGDCCSNTLEEVVLGKMKSGVRSGDGGVRVWGRTPSFIGTFRLIGYHFQGPLSTRCTISHFCVLNRAVPANLLLLVSASLLSHTIFADLVLPSLIYVKHKRRGQTTPAICFSENAVHLAILVMRPDSQLTRIPLYCDADSGDGDDDHESSDRSML